MGKGGRRGRAAAPREDAQKETGRTGPVQKRPTLAHRRENRKSTMRSGRTIGEVRERLETKSERAAARRKDKRKNTTRFILVSVGFVALVIILIILAVNFLDQGREAPAAEPEQPTATSAEPTIEIIDEASGTGSKITNRMREYIGLAEADFRALGLTPVRAVFPVNSIREVDFYLDGYPGYIKLTIDRDPAVSAEDAERMLRYLTGQGITTFEYIDVRLPGKAYWK